MKPLLFCSVVILLVTKTWGAGFETLGYDRTTSVQVAMVSSGGSGEKFHNSILTSKWLQLDPNKQHKLTNLLQKQVAHQIAVMKSGGMIGEALCFDPGYAIRIETNAGRRDFLICLYCSQLYVYDTNGSSIGINMDEEFLIRLKAAYLDEFVLKDP